MAQAAMLIMVMDDGRLLLHLRDDEPGILHPGCWAGFGGTLEDGESVEDAVRREVEEETGIRVDRPIFLCDEVDDIDGRGDRVAMFYLKGGVAPDDIDLARVRASDCIRPLSLGRCRCRHSSDAPSRII